LSREANVLESVRRGTSANNIGTGEGAEKPKRLTIGLALGCGAARGFAHIGVLRTLLANGIRPDVVTGTSIGAVVAGFYAAGHLEAFENWARDLTRGRILGYLDFSLSGSGLIGGNRLAEALVRELGDIRLEDLPVRVAAIATEVGTGHEIWLTRGRLTDAMYASYALPGIFPPFRIGGRWLIDGALVNPVPVSAARSLGARLVIAVNLNADNFGRGTVIQSHGPDFDDEAVPVVAPPPESLRGKAEQLFKRRFFGSPDKPGLSTVMVDAFNIVQDRITRTRLAGDPPDTLIAPRLARFGVFDFHRAQEAIRLGVDATEKSLDNIAEAIEALS
jgi:NTE family protein